MAWRPAEEPSLAERVWDLLTNLWAAAPPWTLRLSTKGSRLSPGVEHLGTLQPMGTKQLASLVFPRK